MSSVAIRKSVNLGRGILNRDKSSILKVHDLLSETCASNGVDACEPSLVLAPAGEAVTLIGPLEEEVSDRRVM